MEDYDYYFSEYDSNYSFTLDPVEDEPEKPHLTGHLHMVSMIIYIIACVLGVPGNAIVIWVTGFKMKKTVNVLWLLHLGVADFVFVVFLPFSIIYLALDFHWPFGVWMCKINSFVTVLNMFGSTLFLTVISLDRYLSTAYPHWSNKFRTLKSACIVCLVVWLSAVALSLPYLYFRDTMVLASGKTVCYQNFHNHSKYLIVMRHNILVWVRFINGFLLPSLTMVVCYSLLAFQVKRTTLQDLILGAVTRMGNARSEVL
ncbi:chemerin-like receptor 2 isoform X2 [Latimeria chalumnae]|uniref:chemerin-like receptor 2 isoform X2 n=1 Tax=Latimeria chalumnae TaxID=7897 RepID=UPI00313CC314